MRTESIKKTTNKKKQLLNPERYLPFFATRDRDRFTISDVLTGNAKKYVLPKGFDYTSDIIKVGNLIYLSGGTAEPSRVGNRSTIAYDINQMEPIKKGDMVHGKFCHNSAPFLEKYIYCAGGKSDATLLSVAERYNIETDKWTELGLLNEEKHCVGICILSLRFIYVFGGWLERKKSNMIEKFDLLDEDTGWKIVPYTCKEGDFARRTGVGCLQNSNIGIVVFGGMLKQGGTSEVYQFQFGSLYLKHGRLKSNSEFFCTKSIQIGRIICSGDYAEGKLHKFNMLTHNWS